MNKIWGGMIIISILSALLIDISHLWQTDRATYKLHIIQSSNTDIIATFNKHNITLKKQNNYYLVESQTQTNLPAKVVILSQTTQLVNIKALKENYSQIQKLTEKGFDMAKFAIKLALGLAGLMGLWLGLMRIAEKSGLIDKLVFVVRPLLKFLFPEIPKNHPVLGTISLNLSANVLGLGNAATPLGIRAMQQLQEINSHKNSASNSMCMFLALNTSSVQLLPPVTLIAVMGMQVQQLIIPIILATSCSTIAAYTAVRLFIRFYPQQEQEQENG